MMKLFLIGRLIKGIVKMISAIFIWIFKAFIFIYKWIFKVLVVVFKWWFKLQINIWRKTKNYWNKGRKEKVIVIAGFLILGLLGIIFN